MAIFDRFRRRETPEESGAVNGFRALGEVIGREQIEEATRVLQEYKRGKAMLETKIVENEQWYKLRHWECMRRKENEEIQPASGWLFNCIASKHAEAMDSYPEPSVLPREEGDKPEAERLSSILPVVMDQNDFEEVYSDVQMYKLKAGTGVYGVFWDADKLNGLGDVSVKKVDLINVFWEPGLTDIQASKNFFSVELKDNDELIGQYPQLAGRLGTPTIDVAKYKYDESIDTSDKSVVVDWYYKKRVDGRVVLHYVKYVNDVVLYATENDPATADRGLYDHGEYPFIFDTLYKVEGSPAGFGFIDVGKDAQEYIDRGNQAILMNTLANSRPRYFIRTDGAVNEDEYADTTKPFIHVDGNLGQDSVVPVEGKPLSDIYVSVVNNKIDELKEITGNRDVASGGTTGGVTAASGIAAMQEAAAKLARDYNRSSYRAYKEVVLLVIELIRQFYDMPRQFRIMGENGAERYISYTNQGIQPQPQGDDFGVYMGMRVPLFDVEVSAAKATPYSKMSQNELALQFYGQGFFNPQMADQALACLDMMDFERKEFVMQKISQNGTMYQMIQQLQQQMMALGAMVDQMRGTNEVTASLAQQFGMGGQPMPAGGPAEMPAEATESPVTAKARERVAASTQI